MLSLKNLKSNKGGAAAVAKYCEHERNRRSGGYYSEGGAPSFWYGRGADALGLFGPVNHDIFVAALEGRLPDGTDVGKRGNVTQRRLGVDLTLSAPKSVSIAALPGGDGRILDAQDRAVRSALAFLEREVLVARRGRGGVQVEHTGSILAAIYRHEDSRPVDGHADPQLHSHAIIINATQRVDGQWSAVDLQFGDRSVLMKLADAHYKNELARELQSMGYDIRRTEDGIELAHISDEQVACFSVRTKQIDAALADRGLTRESASAAERAAANTATREDKKQIDRDKQMWEWRTEAREAGVDLAIPQARDLSQRQNFASESVKSAVRHLSERETVFSRDALRLESLKAGMGDTTLADIEHEIAAGKGGLIEAGGDRYTTKEALFQEQHTLARVRAGHDAVDALMTPEAASAFITEAEASQGFRFSQGQSDALAHMTTTADRSVGAEGLAGSGKTTAMRAGVSAFRAAGYEVVGLGPSTRAVKEIQSAGADTTCTLHSLLASKDESGAKPRLYLVDEASMIGATDMDRLIERVEIEGARLVLIGDYRQLSSVERGSPFEQFIAEGALRTERIHEIQRQRDPALRKCVQAFGDGDAPRGAELSRQFTSEVAPAAADFETACVKPQPGKLPPTSVRRAALVRTVADRYLGLPKEDREKTLLLATNNEMRRSINARIRAALKSQGEIAGAEVSVSTVRDAQMTREQRARAELYQPGQVVRLTEGNGKTRTVTNYEVVREECGQVILRVSDGQERAFVPARMDQRRYQVFNREDRVFSAGDKVVFRAPDRERGIANGQSGEVIALDIVRNEMHVRLDDRREIVLPLSGNLALDHGWARTVHDAQGSTVDHCIAAIEAGRAATAQVAYVALSRARERAEILTDSWERLKDRVSTFIERESAIQATHAKTTHDVAKLRELRAEASAELGHAGDLSQTRERAEASAELRQDSGRWEEEIELER